QAAHARTLGELQATHVRMLDEAASAHARTLESAIREQERLRSEHVARHDTLVAAMRTEHAEALARVVVERDAHARIVEQIELEREDLEARLLSALAEREEVAAAASVRER